MNKQYYAVYETDYSDDGSRVYLAKSAAEAKRMLIREVDGAIELSQLTAVRLTKEQYALRVALEALDEIRETLKS